jgi:HEAT repeat protein
MTIEELIQDKGIKAKAKVTQIGEWLVNGELSPEELMAFSETLKGSAKANCVEAFEYATKLKPEIADESLLAYSVVSLKDKEPRIKWESAKVIGNIAHRFPDQLEEAISGLLINATDSGTVVRWAAAFALGEILKLKTERSLRLVPLMDALSEKETENGVKKKYLDALKKVKKK